MKKVVVTGGAGFIGSNLVKLLLSKNFKVTVIDDLSVGKKEILDLNNKNLKFLQDDIRDKKKMVADLKDADCVYHLAVQCVRKSIRDPWLVHSVNAEGTLSVLDAALKNKVKKFVYVSSSEVYGSAEKVPMYEEHSLKPTTVYGASKLAGELYALSYFRTYGLNTTIVRPFNTYGYNEHFEGPYGEVIPRFVVRALNDLPIQIFGDGSQTRDFTFVSDTAEGIYRVSESGAAGEIYNIARGQEVAVIDLAHIIQRVLKKDVEIQFLPSRPGDVMRHSSGFTKAAIELGFEAKYGIVTGVNEYISWFKAQYPNPQVALKFYQEKNW